MKKQASVEDTTDTSNVTELEAEFTRPQRPRNARWLEEDIPIGDSELVESIEESSPSPPIDTQDDFPPFSEPDADNEFEETPPRSTQRTYSRTAVDTYQMWLRYVHQMQPSRRTPDYQIITKRLSASQEVELFQKFELVKQQIVSLLRELPSVVLSRLSVRGAPGDGSKQPPSDKLILNVIGNRKPLEQIREAIDEMQAEHPSEEVAMLKQVWQDLSRELEQLEKIREVIFQNNVRLVTRIATGHPGSGMDLMDLIQEGNIGLMKAIDRFDLHRGVRFSTYAIWWIRQSIGRGCENQSRTIRIPSHLVEERSIFVKFLSQLTQDLQKEPTRFEIAEALDCSVDRVDRFFKHPVTHIQLEHPIIPQTAAEYQTWCDIVGVDNNLQDDVQTWDAPVEIELTRLRFLAELDEFMTIGLYRIEIASLLSPRERHEVKNRLGWEDNRSKPLLEMGIVLAIARERAKQRFLLEREPSLQTVIDALNLPLGILDRIQATVSVPLQLDRPIKSETIVELVFALIQVCVSEPIPDLVITDSEISPEGAVDSRLDAEVVEEVVNTLNAREIQVIKQRYGLINGKETTLAEIGRQLGISRERVRQIEKRAFAKLRHPARWKYLQELL